MWDELDLLARTPRTAGRGPMWWPCGIPYARWVTEGVHLAQGFEEDAQAHEGESDGESVQNGPGPDV